MSIAERCTCDRKGSGFGEDDGHCHRHDIGLRPKIAKPFDRPVTVPSSLLLRAAALLSERAPCADQECRVSDDGEVMRCYNELCAAARGMDASCALCNGSGVADLPDPWGGVRGTCPDCNGTGKAPASS